MVEKDHGEAQKYGMLCHLTALAMFVVPFGNIIGPLVVWLLKKDEYPFVDEQGKESMNFQISMIIYLFVSGFLILAGIGLIMLPLLFIADLILVVVAAVKVSDGETYQYPLTIRFLK